MCPTCQRIRDAIGRYLYNILLNLDVDGNVYVIGLIVVIMKILNCKNIVPAAGNAHYSISQTCAEMEMQGSHVGQVGCKVLTIMFKPFFWNDPTYNHCASAMKNVPWDETVG